MFFSVAQLCLFTIGTVTAGNRRWVSPQRFLPLIVFSVKNHLLPLFLLFLLFANTANQLAIVHSLCLTADGRSVLFLASDRKSVWISATKT